MSNSFHAGFFEESMTRRAARQIMAQKIRPLRMPAEQNLKFNRMQNEDLRRVMSNPVQRFRRLYRRGD